MSTIIAKPGFEKPVEAAQVCFRVLLHVLSRPGKIKTLPLLPPSITHGCPVDAKAMAGFLAIALSLCDADTNIWLDESLQCPELKQHLRFHCASPLVTLPEKAHFAFINNVENMPKLQSFCQGSAAYPDTSTTIIIACPFAQSEADSVAYTLKGPGIKASEMPLRLKLAAGHFPERFWQELQENTASYPLGVDIIFVNSVSAASAEVMALPRSVQLQAL